jgi:hypothetical protein
MRQGRGVEKPTLFKAEVNEEYNCTSTPPLKLPGLFQSELYNIFFGMLHYGVL